MGTFTNYKWNKTDNTLVFKIMSRLFGRKLLESMAIENFIYYIVVIGALLNFLPFILVYFSRNPGTHLFPPYLKKSSSQLTNSLIASLSISVPILFDGILDYLASAFSSLKLTKTSHYYFPFREMILFIVIPDVLFLFWIIPYEQYDILAGLLLARDTMFTYSNLAYMVRNKNPIWTWWTTIPIILPLMSANIIFTNVIPSQVFSLSGHIDNAFSLLVILLVSTALAVLTVNMIRWFLFVKREFAYVKNEEVIGRLIHFSVCAVCYYIFILGDWCICYLPKSISPAWTSP